ncbi:MAG TPA: phosphoglycerate dehydrogenase [Longimicrobiales bacterium]
MFKVLIADVIPASALEPLSADDRFELVERPGLKGDDLARSIEGMDAVIVRSSTTITRESLSRADTLRVIGRAGVGVDNIDVAAATERGIAVLNAPSGNTISAAELAFALLLAVARRITAADRSMKSGEWDRKSFTGMELSGKTLGLIGAGRIGGEVARRAKAFGMRVVAFDPFLNAERAQSLGIELDTLDGVLRAADVISLHTPLTEQTAGMIGDAQLALLRKGALVINAARGGVVDEAALLRALESGHLGGAALDVFSAEPLPADHPLRSAPNVVLTPHVGASTKEAQQNVAVEIAAAVRAALLDGDLTSAVNAPAIGGDAMRRLRPLVELAEKLGRLGAALIDGPLAGVTVRYAGPDEQFVKPLAAAAIAGALRGAVGASGINTVNAMHIAELRGIDVERAGVAAHGSDEEFLDVRLRCDGDEVRIAGAVVAGRHARLVRINRFRVVVRAEGSLVVLRNRDVPGVIGRVGTLLGEAGINIAEYHQARLQAGGEALAAISVDGTMDEVVLRRLRALPEIIDVRQANLD